MPLIPYDCLNYVEKLKVAAPKECLIPAITDVFVRAGYDRITHEFDCYFKRNEQAPHSFTSRSTLLFHKTDSMIMGFIDWEIQTSYFGERCNNYFKVKFGFAKEEMGVRINWVEYTSESECYWKGISKELHRPHADFSYLYEAFDYLNKVMEEAM